MSPDALTLLERVRRLGVRIGAEGDMITLSPRGVVPAGLKAELLARNPELLALLRPAPALGPTEDLQAAYRRWFELAAAEAEGLRADPTEASTLYQEIVRLIDEAGPLWADAVYADELRRFARETARCGVCGGLRHGSQRPESR